MSRQIYKNLSYQAEVVGSLQNHCQFISLKIENYRNFEVIGGEQFI
jgi:hypothetical protein